MKYCRVCKIRAPEAALVCSKCGGPVSTFGAGISQTRSRAGEPATGVLSLQGQIRQLEQTRHQLIRRTGLLGIACTIIALALVLTGYVVYYQTVLSYAVLKNVDIQQDPTQWRNILVSFDVVKPGKVAFGRHSGSNRTEKFDLLGKTGEIKFSWQWASDPKSGIDFTVVFRDGLTRDTVGKHFEPVGR